MGSTQLKDRVHCGEPFLEAEHSCMHVYMLHICFYVCLSENTLVCMGDHPEEGVILHPICVDAFQL